jgi:heme/copper-type cytochrome/quinol oxidase subunit 2
MRSRAIIPLLLLAGLVVAFAPLPVRPVAPIERTFRIEASQYTYDPGEISVNPGDRVTIELVATDVVHGLYVDGYGISTTADPGQTSTLTFIADKAGSFRLRCNVTCGAMHPFMIGRLSVGLNSWLYRSIGLAFIGILSSFVFIRPTKVAR